MKLRDSLKNLWRFHRQHNGFVVLQRYADQHLTPTGKAVFLLFLFSLSLGMVGTDVLVYVLLCSLGGLWVSELGLGTRWRPRQLQTSWQVPERVVAGKSFDFNIHISNPAHPVFSCFIELEWRQGGHTVILHSDSVFYLGQGQSSSFSLSLPAAVRGQAQLVRANLVSVFPLNLVFWRQPLPCKAHYWVYPTASPLRLPTPQHINPPIQQTEFQSLRPWSSGDSPRYLHWQALARTGQLVVRNYQQLEPNNTGLWLDLALPAAAADFEAAVSLVRRLLEDQLQQTGMMPELNLGEARISAAQGYALALQALCSIQPQTIGPETRIARLNSLLTRAPAQLLLVSTQAEGLAEDLRRAGLEKHSHCLLYAVQSTPPQPEKQLYWLPTAQVLP